MKTTAFSSALNGLNEAVTQLLNGAANFSAPQPITLLISRAKRSLKLLALLMMLLLSGAGVMATNYYTWTSGDPTNTNLWWTNDNGTGTHPTIFTNTGDVFIIQNNNTMTATVSWTVSNLTINAGAALNTGSDDNNLYLVGNFTNNGTLTAHSSDVIINGNGDQTISGFTTGGSVTLSKPGGTATFVGNVNGGGLLISGNRRNA